MMYVTYDKKGNLTGAYSQDLHPDHNGAHIEVRDTAVYANWTEYKANAARDGLEITPEGEAAAMLRAQLTETVVQSGA